MNILWVLNKYVDGGSLSRFYPEFLKKVEEEGNLKGHKFYFVFFSDAMRAKAKTKNNLFYNEDYTKTKNIAGMASRIEVTYGFTFKQAYFPDMIQVSKSQDYRKVNLAEDEINNLEHLIPRFLYLERIFKNKRIDAVICDQSSETEMEFARSICLKSDKIFLRHMECFLGRAVFAWQKEFGKELIALPKLNEKYTMRQAKEFIGDFVSNNRFPYEQKQFLKANFKDYYLPRLLRFYLYPQFIKQMLMKPYYFIEEKILKAFIRSKYDKKKPYLFFGLHLPTESTMALRALPYMTQLNLVESISRVLPYGHYLYVREHPAWKTHFPFKELKKIRKMPNVRLISTKIPISDIIKNSRGILTYNSTTGIEALMYGRPVLSFASNIYSGIHPSAYQCTDLYELGEMLTRLVNSKVDRNDTHRYIYKLLRSSTEVSLYAGTFLSNEDSANKAKIFTNHLLSAVNYCLSLQKRKNGTKIF